MNQPKKEIEGLGFVLQGSFNPQIFSPFWFSSENLIPQIEAEKAKVEIIHPQATSFSTDWFKLTVANNTFSLATLKNSHFESLRDLIIGTFQILKHTPIAKVGIFRTYHFRMSLEELHEFEGRLAPKEIWKDAISEPKFAVLVMQGKRTDNYHGFIQVNVQPSPDINPGIFVQIIDHFEVNDEKNLKGCVEVMEIIPSVWIDNEKRAESILSKLWR